MVAAVKLVQSLQSLRRVSPMRMSGVVRGISMTRGFSDRPAARCTCPVTAPQHTARSLQLVPPPAASNPWRCMSSRKDCSTEKLPTCSPERIAKSACAKRKKKEAKRVKSPFQTMWENPQCCLDPCPDAVARFDSLYYKISDKAKRKYMQTWVECPKMKIIPKKVCCYEQMKMPPIKKRKRAERPVTACAAPKCMEKTGKKCPKTRMPRCRGAREPPHCITERGPADCHKVCTPYPSFSECRSPLILPPAPRECLCLAIRPMCAAWAAWRRKLTHKR